MNKHNCPHCKIPLRYETDDTGHVIPYCDNCGGEWG
jgi:Zn-finger nucleic acid-binding protein